MTAARIKKVLFAILLAIAAYIWWGNIQSITSAGEEDVFIPDATPRRQTARQTKNSIPYLAPTVNPFRRYSVTANTINGVRPLPPPQADPLHIAHKLKGIVGKGNTAQAVIQLPDQTSRIVSLSDSVGVWRVKEIRDLYVTFVHGKQHDTLFLNTKGL